MLSGKQYGASISHSLLQHPCYIDTTVAEIFRWLWTFALHLHVYLFASIRVADKPQDHEELSSNTSRLNRIRAFCTGQELLIYFIIQVPGWNLVNEDGTQKLHRSWKVKTFVRGMEFLRLVADVAEAEGHHPDLHLVGWNNVKIDIWTHAVGGLTENDFILAAKINGLNLHHLLRITPTNK
ncbi:hypothetical protein BUALT_Bualt18G0122000 [Buddleja alternifolia]|uniref:4a-hydroxytetrahydrobiopterin dehydratase n=1 Tax=Buddleja alternifolia TaxID=168488 RepID=A0AAV6W4Y1_9LAMI|nr:hypothetical protein BUALT_Bualt18G0122000 [Buddleja alternifolia]